MKAFTQGIYAIRRLDTNEIIYIGQSVNIARRWKGYRYAGFHNAILQEILAEIGIDQLGFEVVEEVAALDGLNQREQYYIDLYHPIGNLSTTQIDSSDLLASYSTTILPRFGCPLIEVQHEGEVYYSMRELCITFGVDPLLWIARVQNHQVVAEYIRLLPFPTTTGIIKLYCLAQTALAYWILWLDVRKVKPAYQAELKRFHEEMKPMIGKLMVDHFGWPPIA